MYSPEIISKAANEKRRAKRIYKVTLIGSLVNALLIVLKFVAGVFGHSSAMMADAIHSFSDFATDLVVLAFVRISGKPSDCNHRYGHGKFETIATAFIAIVLIGVGLFLLYGGVVKIVGYYIDDTSIEKPGMIALWIALISILFKEALYRYTAHVGREEKSSSVVANAWHHRSDAYSSIATLLGIGGAILLGDRWIVLEPIAACLVSFFIIKVGIDLIRPAMRGLSDASLGSDIEEEIKELIGKINGVCYSKDLRTRDLGNAYGIELTIYVSGMLTVSEGHDITEEVERRLRNQYGNSTHTVIHVEPEQNDERKDMS